jgi:hypothetical protein
MYILVYHIFIFEGFMDKNIINSVLSTVKMPLVYDPYGQIIFDSDNNQLLDVRGWGMFQYKEGGEKIQDAFAAMVVESFNEKYGAQK